MGKLTKRGHLQNLLLALGPAIVVACSGSTTQQPAEKDVDDGGGAGSSTTSTSSSSSGGNSSGAAGSSSSGGATGSSSGTVANGEDSGVVVSGEGGAANCSAADSAKGSEVVMIGDSYPALNGELVLHLESLARTAGALSSTDAYRTYYVSGTNLSGGMAPSIPAQFTEAVTANPDIKYVIMDGGGNDILLDNTACITTQPPPASANCVTVINNAIAAANTMFAAMKTAGVQKIVYYFYPHLPTTGKPYVNDTLDYAYPLVAAACAASPVPCTFVDTRAGFEGHTEYIGPDGIHPTIAGSDELGVLVWGAMQQQCIAQ